MALVERLKKGLGELAYTVKSYNGELDDDSIGTARLPLVLVAFGGSRIARMGTNARRHQSKANFVVLVAVRSLRSEVSGRHGGITKNEIGANQLISAVRRLLDAQSLGGLLARPLLPVKVSTVFNSAKLSSGYLSAYSIEFEAVYDDYLPLEDGRFPEKTDDKNHPDYIFNNYNGQLSDPYPEFNVLGGSIISPRNHAETSIEVKTYES